MLASRTAGVIVALGIALLACGGRGGHGERRDAGPSSDSGPPRDAGPTRDAGGGDFHYCPGSSPGMDECRSNADCECGMCLVGPLCGGAGCAAMCGSDTDCSTGEICSGGCCPSCVPACPTTACAEGTRCNTLTGRCNPIPCTEGMACPTNTRCMPSGECVRLSCTSDSDCDCGTCAATQCWDRPGQCCPPLPG